MLTLRGGIESFDRQRSQGCFAVANSSVPEIMTRLGPGRLIYADSEKCSKGRLRAFGFHDCDLLRTKKITPRGGRRIYCRMVLVDASGSN
jgi:hypothetical protein